MKFFKSRLFKLIVATVGVVAITSLSRDIYGLWKKRDVVGERQEVLSALEQENRRLKEKLTEVQSPGYIEKIAREKLGLIKEGESIVLVPKAENNEQKIEGQEKNVPNWKKWWRLFF